MRFYSQGHQRVTAHSVEVGSIQEIKPSSSAFCIVAMVCFSVSSLYFVPGAGLVPRPILLTRGRFCLKVL